MITDSNPTIDRDMSAIALRPVDRVREDALAMLANDPADRRSAVPREYLLG